MKPPVFITLLQSSLTFAKQRYTLLNTKTHAEDVATTQGHYRAQGVEKGPAGPCRRCHRGQRDSGTLNSPAGLPLRTGKTSNWADKTPGLVAKACATLCDPMDCSPAGSSAHRISQARMLEWFALSFFRRPSQHRDLRRILYQLSHQGSPKCLRQQEITRMQTDRYT